MLRIGELAPDFTLPDQNERERKLSDYRGKKVVLFFYPRDNTPRCSRQAEGFRDLYQQFVEKNIEIIGINKDGAASHKRFITRLDLPYTLLSDKDMSVLEAYDIWQEKRGYGKKYMGIVRTTYVLDEEGVIIWASDTVNGEENAAEVLAWLNTLE